MTSRFLAILATAILAPSAMSESITAPIPEIPLDGDTAKAKGICSFIRSTHRETPGKPDRPFFDVVFSLPESIGDSSLLLTTTELGEMFSHEMSIEIEPASRKGKAGVELHLSPDNFSRASIRLTYGGTNAKDSAVYVLKLADFPLRKSKFGHVHFSDLGNDCSTSHER